MLISSDEISMINRGTDRTRAARVTMHAKQQQERQTRPPEDPIHDIRMFDFGKDAAVMLSRHTPHRGGKPCQIARVRVLRDVRRPLVVSRQTTIQSAAAPPPSASYCDSVRIHPDAFVWTSARWSRFLGRSRTRAETAATFADAAAKVAACRCASDGVRNTMVRNKAVRTKAKTTKEPAIRRRGEVASANIRMTILRNDAAT